LRARVSAAARRQATNPRQRQAPQGDKHAPCDTNMLRLAKQHKRPPGTATSCANTQTGHAKANAGEDTTDAPYGWGGLQTPCGARHIGNPYAQVSGWCF
jgi:hypothetical protein